MNAWFVAAAALLLATLPPIVVLVRADTMSRLVAFEVISVLIALVLVTLGQAYDRQIYADLGLVLSVLSIVTGVLYARFVERWL